MCLVLNAFNWLGRAPFKREHVLLYYATTFLSLAHVLGLELVLNPWVAAMGAVTGSLGPMPPDKPSGLQGKKGR